MSKQTSPLEPIYLNNYDLPLVLDGKNIYKGFTWSNFFLRNVGKLSFVKKDKKKKNYGVMDIVVYIVRRHLLLIFRDVIHEGLEYIFFNRDIPYMRWGVFDFKDVSPKHVYKAKYRGHFYKLASVTSRRFFMRLGKRMILIGVPWKYWQVFTKLIKSGKDYPPVNDFTPNYNKYGR